MRTVFLGQKIWRADYISRFKLKHAAFLCLVKVLQFFETSEQYSDMLLLSIYLEQSVI